MSIELYNTDCTKGFNINNKYDIQIGLSDYKGKHFKIYSDNKREYKFYLFVRVFKFFLMLTIEK